MRQVEKIKESEDNNMTKSEENRYRGKAEAILMGMTQKIDGGEDELNVILQTILQMYRAVGLTTTPTPNQILAEVFKNVSDKDAKIAYVGVSVLMGQFRVINFAIDSPEEPIEDITSEDGIFGYCYNIDAPDLSELGYLYFDIERGILKRIA